MLSRFIASTLAIFSLSAATLPTRAADPIELPLHRQSKIRFASVEEGTQRLGQADPFTAELSRFDCQVRLGTAEAVGSEDVRRQAASQVIAWTDEDMAKVTMA